MTAKKTSNWAHLYVWGCERLRSTYHSDRSPALAAPAPVWFGSDGNACGSAVWLRCEATTRTTTSPKRMTTTSRHTVAPRSLSLASRVRRRSLTLRLQAQMSTSIEVKLRLMASIAALPLFKCLRLISLIKSERSRKWQMMFDSVIP